jgi:site-specific recombinase XerD
MQKDDIINKIVFEVSKQYSGSENIVKNILIRELYQYDLVQKETAIVEYNGGKNQEYIKRFIVAKAVCGCTKRTLEQYRNTVWKVLCEIGKTADEVTSDDIRYYLATKQMRDHVSLSYCNTLLRYLSSFFKFLAEEELIVRSPTLKCPRIKCEKNKKAAFTEMEVELIRGACENARETMIVEVLLSTACRISEFAQIKISDIESNGRILIFGKGKKERYVYLNAKAQLAIKNYLSEREDDNPYLNPASIVAGSSNEERAKELQKLKNGNWYRYKQLVNPDGHGGRDPLSSLIRRIGARAGVEKCHAHRFRRTCATFALRRGMPIEQVSKMLGHEELGTTQLYLDLTEKDLEAAHDKYVI